MSECLITEDMLNAIPEEWKEQIKNTPDVYKGPSPEEIKAIDAMLIMYFHSKSKASLAKIMKTTTNELDKRIRILKEQGKL